MCIRDNFPVALISARSVPWQPPSTTPPVGSIKMCIRDRSGTSFAAPQITGALARLHEQYQYPLREARRRLLAAGRPIPDFGQAIRILPGI